MYCIAFVAEFSPSQNEDFGNAAMYYIASIATAFEMTST